MDAKAIPFHPSAAVQEVDSQSVLGQKESDPQKREGNGITNQFSDAEILLMMLNFNTISIYQSIEEFREHIESIASLEQVEQYASSTRCNDELQQWLCEKLPILQKNVSVLQTISFLQSSPDLATGSIKESQGL